ncbi:hypothetical protein MINTM021_11110 [Mycobacterium paraintracellulare]|nr:hypothetical protein MINTM021_11110 [Mycobacterium paraintracellulare]
MTARRRGKTENGRSSARRDLVITEIYAQAARLFAERGYAGTSLQHVAAATGLSRQALYHYVKSKDELLSQLVTDITRSPTTELQAINRRVDLTCVQKLRAIAYSIAAHRAADPYSFLLVIRSEAELPEVLATKHRDGKRAVLVEIIKVVEAGIHNGEFRRVDPRVAAFSIIGMLNWVAWWYHPDRRYPSDTVDAIANKVADMAVSVVGHRIDPGADGRDPASVLDSMRADLDILERAISAEPLPDQ